MKKLLILSVALAVLMLTSLTASAHDWGSYENDSNWHHSRHTDIEAERGMPFGWHDSYESMREHHRLERIHDREWEHRFPGLHAYRWNGHEGFWHHGHYVTDAVLFFDDNNELVSVGYMADGVFIHFREDHETYENHDSFFISWWHR